MGYKRIESIMRFVSTAPPERFILQHIQTATGIKMKTNRQTGEKKNHTMQQQKHIAHTHVHAAVQLNEACCDTLLWNACDSKKERIIVSVR